MNNLLEHAQDKIRERKVRRNTHKICYIVFTVTLDLLKQNPSSIQNYFYDSVLAQPTLYRIPTEQPSNFLSMKTKEKSDYSMSAAPPQSVKCLNSPELHIHNNNIFNSGQMTASIFIKVERSK